MEFFFPKSLATTPESVASVSGVQHESHPPGTFTTRDLLSLLKSPSLVMVTAAIPQARA